MRAGSRKPAVTVVLFQGRISVEAHRLRRDLQERLDISASRLIARALVALDRELKATDQP
jgi:hypothetical protein